MVCRSVLTLGLLVAINSAIANPVDEKTLVLVTSRDSQLTALDSLTLRKLFLGHPVSFQGSRLIAVRNMQSQLLYQTFLKSVVSMSQMSYEKKLQSGAFRRGRKVPIEVESFPQLNEKIKQDPKTVSYMWKRQVMDNKALKIVQVLWKGKNVN